MSSTADSNVLSHCTCLGSLYVDRPGEPQARACLGQH
jgi:hypothetical protein